MTVDWESEFGLNTLSNQGIADLNQRLMSDTTLYHSYMSKKAGFPDSASFSLPALNYSCLQMNSMYHNEITECIRTHHSFNRCGPL